uniref:Uncharacterized protein n=1 Tax=Octopus bimaculoides TaxID=37653 RepID=A0A0L8HZY5_OCTBM
METELRITNISNHIQHDSTSAVFILASVRVDFSTHEKQTRITACDFPIVYSKNLV